MFCINGVQMLTNPLFPWRIRARERLAKEEGSQRSPELGNVTEAPVYRRQFQHQTQTSPHYHTDPTGPQQAYSQPHRHHPVQLTRPGPPGGQEAGYPSYLSMASGPATRAGLQKQQQDEDTEESEDVKTEGLLRSRKAVLPSEIRRRERSTEDPWRGKGEEEPAVSRVLSLSQARDEEAEDPARRGHRGKARLDESEYTSDLHASEGRTRERENANFIHRGVAAGHIQPRGQHARPGNFTTSPALSRSVSDTGDPQIPSQRNLQHQAHDSRKVREGEGVSNPEIQQDTRVSVAQLRHSYMESATTPPTRRRNEL